jgi:hypothetical protein
MTDRTEFGFTRTVCGCEVCVRNCVYMPGFLLPADLDRMMPKGVEPHKWAEKALLASPGALVASGTDLFRIPTLVPATKANGECMHLDGKLCGIHSIAPFGCAFFDCQDRPERDDPLSLAGLRTIMDAWRDPQSLYRRIWVHLAYKNLMQQKAEVLRQRMRQTSS